MKLNMTIPEALEFADEWSRGMTLYEGSQGWRVVCLMLAEEVRRLAQVEAEHAALKEELESERGETKRWLKKAVYLKDLAYEHKKLADKISAEHEALKKAISDAEPVAHLWQHGETGRTRIVMPDQIVTADANWSVVGPLYTLEGIRTKP